MIIPVGHRILVRQENYDENDPIFKSAKAAGIVVQKDREIRYQASVNVGTVLAMGKTAYKDFGGDPWVEKGDLVVFAKNSGLRVVDPIEKNLPEENQTPFVVLNDEDVVAILRN